VTVNQPASVTLGSLEQTTIVSRLAALEKVIPESLIQDVLNSCDKTNHPGCYLTHPVMMRTVLAMGLFPHLCIRQVFRQTYRYQPDRKTPVRSALCMARQRLGAEPVRELYQRLVKPLATEQNPGAFYNGMRLVGVDGTVMNVPDREATQHFGRNTGRYGSEGAFPKIRKVSLVELGTHIEFSFVYGGWHDGEKTLATQLFDNLPEDALLLADRGFYSYKSWMGLQEKHHLLMRISSPNLLAPVEFLADGSYLTKIYKNHYDRQKDRKGTLVRVIEYTIEDPQRTGHGETHRLMTTLQDADQYPARELISLYHERWEEELVFGEQKTCQCPRRAEQTTHLRSETVKGITQELYALSLAHFVIRATMLEAAEGVNLDVDRLSFTGCFRILQCRLPEYSSGGQQSLDEWYQNLLREFLEEVIPLRRNRINPRVTKHKQSKWNKWKPEDREQPPLTKTFAESVVMKC